MGTGQLEIFITHEAVPSLELKEQVAETMRALPSGPPWLELRPRAVASRTLDPTILVAVIGASGAVLTALVSGLLKLAAEKKKERLVIKGKDWMIEVPQDAPLEEVDVLIAKIKLADAQQILVEFIEE